MVFIKYVLIQLLAYGLEMGVFLVVLEKLSMHLLFSNVLGKIFAGVFAFLAHRSFTFRVESKTPIKKQAIIYFILLTVNIPLSSLILILFHLWILEPPIAKCFADIICIGLSYGLSKYVVFVGSQRSDVDSKYISKSCS